MSTRRLSTTDKPKPTNENNLHFHPILYYYKNMKTLKAILISLVFILFAAIPVFAGIPQLKNVANSGLIQSVQNFFANKCDTLKNKIDKRVNMFGNNEAAHAAVFTKLEDRLSQNITKWEGLGYDVSKLKPELKTLSDEVDKFVTDYKAFIAALKATQDVACGTGTEFSDAMKTARAKLKIVRQDAADIRTFYLTIIRPDIIKLKQQTPVVKED